jgi:hypothetical protein
VLRAVKALLARAYRRSLAVGCPAAAGGLLLATGGACVALVSRGEPLLAAAALLVVPGLAATPFLPRELRVPVIRIAVVPLAGAAISSVAIITMASLDIALTKWTLWLLLLGLAATGYLVSFLTPPLSVDATRTRADFPTSEGATLVFLGAVLFLGIGLQALILGGKPVPGTDWGHYLLYADEIRQRHSLLIHNPYWMFGMPFREDPGAPSLYGGYLLLSGEPTSTLVQGIWVFAVLSILGVFVFVAALWGRLAGLLAAALYGAVPMNLDLLAWHGLANEFGIVLLTLILLAIGMVLRGQMDMRWSAVLAILFVALAAAHRLTFIIGVLTLVPTLLAALVLRFRATLGFILKTFVFVVLVGGGVGFDLIQRNGGQISHPDHRIYLVTKINWDAVSRDLTPVLVGAGGLALLALLVAKPLRQDRAVLVLYGLLAAILAFGYAWVVDVPTVYYRADYFLPLLAAAVVGVASARLLPKVAVPAALVVVTLVALRAAQLAPSFRNFYGFVNQASATGLGLVGSLDKGGSTRGTAIATDGCWAFLAEWLLGRPVLADLDRVQIVPKAEIQPAATARQILYGGERGVELAAKLGVRYALVDPQCTHVSGKPYAPPTSGTPIFVSSRLVVLDLARHAR